MSRRSKENAIANALAYFAIGCASGMCAIVVAIYIYAIL